MPGGPAVDFGFGMISSEAQGHGKFVGAELMSQVTSDLSRYQHLPLDAFERAQLLSVVLFSKWCYRSLFIPHDRMFYEIDQKARIFVTGNPHYVSDPLPQPMWDHRSTGQL